MPNRTARRTYPVVTGVVTFLALFSAASVVVRRSIPQPDEGPLANAQEDYLRDASRLPFKFRELNEETLAEAKRLRRPILLMMGTSGSRSARQADSAGFKDLENAAMIRARYIVCRVDSSTEPLLSTAYLPVTRGRLGYDLGLQVFFLDPDGNLVYHRTTDRPGDAWDVDAVADSLRFAQSRYDERQARSGDPEYRSLSDVHELERNAMLDANVSGAPDLASALKAYLERMDSNRGSWARPWGTKLMPLAWEFVLRQGGAAQVEENMRPILTSGMVDWIDGGFFSQMREEGFGSIELDKSAEVNAQMAQLCAQLYRATGKRFYKTLAEGAFDFVSSRMVDEEGVVMPYQLGDPLPQRRSEHASFSPRRMRELFSGAERDQLRSLFRLRVEENPQMLPAIRDLDAMDQNPEPYLKLLERMREDKKEVERKIARMPSCSSSCYAVARLLKTARLLHDGARSKTAMDLYQGLSRFTIVDRSGVNIVDLMRSPRLDKEVHPVLSDYLAFADASFQFYLSSRSEFALADGARMLRLAIERFDGGALGVLLHGSPQSDPHLPPNTLTPEIVDTDLPASNAHAALLAQDYALTLDRVFGEDTFELRAFGESAIRHYSVIAAEIPMGCAGFFLAVASWDSGTTVLVRSDDRDIVAHVVASAPFATVIPIGGSPGKRLFEIIRGGKSVLSTDDQEVAARAAGFLPKLVN